MLAPLLLASLLSSPADYVERFLSGDRALEAGHLSDAKAAFETCLELRPGCATIAFYLACVAARSKQSESALDWLERAAEWGYDDARVAESEPDLAPIRDTDRFRSALERMRTKLAARPAKLPEAELDWALQGMSPEVSPDGERLLIGRGGLGYLVDVQTGVVIAVLSRPGESISQAAFSPDGRFIVTGMQGVSGPREKRHALLEWDAHSGGLVREIDPGYWQAHLSFSADGSRLLCAGVTPDESIAVFEVASGKLVTRIAAHMTRLSELSPDGKRALVVEDSMQGATSSALWNAETGEKIAAFDDLGRPMMQGGFSADGALCFVLGHAPPGLHLFDGRTGAPKPAADKITGSFQYACFIADGKELLTSDPSGHIQRWDTASGECKRTFEIGAAPDWFVVRPSDDGRFVLLSSQSDSVRMIDGASGNTLWTNDKTSAAWLQGVRFFDHGDEIAIGSDGDRVELRRSQSGELVRAFRSPSLELLAPLAAPDGTRAAIACSDGNIRIVDLASGRAQRRIDAFAAAPCAVDWSEHGDLIAVARGNGEVRVFDANSGVARGGMPAVRAEDVHWSTLAVAFAPDGHRLLAYAGESPTRLLDVDSGSITTLEPVTEAKVTSVAFRAAWSSDGKQIATADAQGQVVVWKTEEHIAQERVIPVGHRAAALAFDPRGERLFVGSNDALARVYSLDTGSETIQLSHKDEDIFGDLTVAEIAFSPSGDQVLTTSYNFGELRAWDPASGRMRWKLGFGGGNGGVLHARYNPDGTRIGTSGQTKFTARVVDAKDGRVLGDLADRDVGDLRPTRSDRWWLGLGQNSVRVFDGRSLRTLYTRVELEHDGFLLSSPSLHCDGTDSALRQVRIVTDAGTATLEEYAAILLDPKRVRASANGIDVARAVLPPAPKLSIDRPLGRTIRVTDNQASIEFSARCVGGVAGFEVETDGKRIPCAIRVDPTDTSRTQASCLLDGPAPGRTAHVSVRAIGNDGVLSRPALVTLVHAH